MIHENLLAGVPRYERWWLYMVLPLVSLLLHWKVLGMDLQGMHVWRQTQTQQTIDAYLEEDFNLFNPRLLERGKGDGIVRLEFPLYQWLVALMGKLAGGGVLLSRLFSFSLGLLGIWGVYWLLCAWLKARGIALLGAFLMCFSPAWYYYSVCPLPDVLALSLGIWGLVFLMRAIERFTWPRMVAIAICFGTASLVKLPYGMLYAAAGTWWMAALVRKPFLPRARMLGIAAILLLSTGPAVAWYTLGIPQWGTSGVTRGIFDRSAAWGSLPGIISYHALQMFPRILISFASLPFVLVGAAKGGQWLRKYRRISLQAWSWMGFCGAFSLFYAYEILTIGVDHDYYLLPIIPFLVALAGLGAWAMLTSRLVAWKVVAVCLLLAMPVMTYRRIHPRWEDANAEFNLDWALHRDALRAAVPDDALVVAGPDVSHCIFLYYIHKKGWCWDANQTFSAQRLRQWISDGARYLYSDDRHYDQDSAIGPLLGPEIGQYGSVRVYALPQAQDTFPGQ